MATAQPTIDYDAIRSWVEARGGHPARVKATGSEEDPGILRIDFPGFSGEDSLEEIGWDEFFEWFERNNLAALLSDEEGNRFNKLIDRSSAGISAAAGGGRSPIARLTGAARRVVAKIGGDRKPATRNTAKKRGTRKSSASPPSAQAKSSAKRGETGAAKQSVAAKKPPTKSALARSRARTTSRSGGTTSKPRPPATRKASKPSKKVARTKAPGSSATRSASSSKPARHR
jgi:hypothetical protein